MPDVQRGTTFEAGMSEFARVTDEPGDIQSIKG